MEIEKWSDIAPSFIKVPINIYKHRHLIQKWWKHLLVYANRGDTNIVVTGRPNVGKSVMASYLYGETNNLSWELPETSKEVEAKALTLGNWTKIMRVIPGQTSNERYLGLHEAFDESSKLEGIIYVVDWGYTDVRDMTVKQEMIENRGLKMIQDLQTFNLKAYVSLILKSEKNIFIQQSALNGEFLYLKYEYWCIFLKTTYSPC